MTKAANLATLGSQAPTFGGTPCSAWCTFTGGGTTRLGSFNVSSITYNGAGDYTFNFTTALANTTYYYVGQGYGGGANYQICGGSQGNATVKNTGSLRVQYGYIAALGGGLTNQDPSVGYIAVFA